MSLRAHPRRSRRRPSPGPALGALLCGVLLAACGPASKGAGSAEGAEKSATTEAASPTDDGSADEDVTSPEDFHRVIFADRTSMGYLLLLPDADEPAVPSRASIGEDVEATFGARTDNAEVDLALDFIEMEPKDTIRSAADASDVEAGVRVARATFDLIGFHIDVLPVEGLIPAEALTDPILTRDVPEAERAGLAQRKWALLLRGDYRNLNGVRGLRLLQTIVRVEASRRGALIHDPDTLETMSLERFSERRLRTELGNVADQVAVIPFPDEEMKGRVRLATRGMRRFGVPDLELDGLQPDPDALQKATFLLHGLALVLIREAEVHESGFAVEAPDVLTVHAADVERAYSAREARPPACDGCQGFVRVHLVRRLGKDTDATEHPVVRVIAPRSESDDPAHDHAAWVARALSRLLGDS